MADFISLNGYTVKDPAAGKSLSMSGSSLSLLNGAGTALSTVVIPTGNVKFTEFVTGFTSADFGELNYIDPAPVIGASLGDFVYVEAKSTAVNPGGYWVNTRQETDGKKLKVVGLTTAPINQPLVLIVTKLGDGTNANPYEAICVPTAPNRTFYDLSIGQAATWKETYQKLLNWKPCTRFGTSKAFAAFSGAAANTEFLCDSSSPYGANRLFLFNDHSYAAVGFMYQSGYTANTLYNVKFKYYPYYYGGDPGPCPGVPEQLLVVANNECFMDPLHVSGLSTELEVPDGQNQVSMPNDILLAMGHWV